MTTRYVSNTTSNGYTSGANTGVGTTKGAPWLTLTYALASISTGDTIVVNGGTYLEVAYLLVQVANLTFTSDGAVTIQNATGSDSRVMHLQVGGTGFVMNTGFTIDAQGANASCITTAVAPNSVFTLHGPTLKNFTTNGVQAFECTLVLDQGWSVTTCPTVSTGAGVYCSPLTGAPSAKYTISNGTVTLGVVGVTQSFGIRYGSATGGSSFSVSGCTVTATLGASRTFRAITANQGACAANLIGNVVTITVTGASNDFQGVASTGGGGSVISGNTITLTVTSDGAPGSGIYCQPTLYTRIESNIITATYGATAVSVFGIICPNPATSGGRLEVLNNTITMPPGSVTYGGISMQIGDNSLPTLRNAYASLLVANNVVSGGNHGILIGFVNNYASVGNRISNTVIGCVDKQNNVGTALPGTWTRNQVSKLDGTPANGALRCKGSNGTIYDSNWVILDASSPSSEFILCNEDTTGPVYSYNCVYRNNVLYGKGGVVLALPVSVNTGSSATFSSNVYFTTGSFGANSFQYGASFYSTIAAWAAAYEANAVAADPTLRAQVLR